MHPKKNYECKSEKYTSVAFIWYQIYICRIYLIFRCHVHFDMHGIALYLVK